MSDEVQGSAKLPTNSPPDEIADYDLAVVKERDELRRRIDAALLLGQTFIDGYRVSGDHSTWDGFHEGQQDAADVMMTVLEGDVSETAESEIVAPVADSFPKVLPDPAPAPVDARADRWDFADWVLDFLNIEDTNPPSLSEAIADRLARWQAYPWSVDGHEGHYSAAGVEEFMALPLRVLFTPDENGEP